MDNSLLTDEEIKNLRHALTHLKANRIHDKDKLEGWYCGVKSEFIKRHCKAIDMIEQWLKR